MLDIQNLSHVELQELICSAQDRLEARREEELAALRAKWELDAASIGLTVKEVLKKPISIRYKNPQIPGETWTGRGHAPAWLKDKIENGAQLEDFAI